MKCPAAGMYGGWTAALLLRAVLSDAIDQGSPSTLTVHFIKAITPGSEVKIRTQNIGGGRSLSIWQAEVQVAGTESVAAIAAVVLSKRRESHSFTDMFMPSAPPPETLAEFHVLPEVREHFITHTLSLQAEITNNALDQCDPQHENRSRSVPE